MGKIKMPEKKEEKHVMKNRKENAMGKWVIAECSTESDAIDIRRFAGTETEVKEYMASLIEQIKAEDPDGYEYGTEGEDDIDYDRYGFGLSAYAVFSDSHAILTALPEEMILDAE